MIVVVQSKVTHTFIEMRAGMRVMAAELIGGVSTVIREVAQLRAVHTVSVGALELRVGVAGLHPRRAQSHVVLVRTVPAVVHAVAYLVSGRKRKILVLFRRFNVGKRKYPFSTAHLYTKEV